jgi:hypothetical protein
MAEYRTRAPASAVAHGDLYSQKTANADGTLAIRGIDDSADTIIDVKEGVVYPIAIKQITRASCSAGLQIANAVALLY